MTADDTPLGAEFAALFASATIGMARIESRTRRILAVNAGFAAMLGYDDPTELAGRASDALLHPDDAAAGPLLYDAIVAKGGASGEARFIGRDGRTVWVRVEAALVRDPDGRARRAIAIVHDVTAERMATAQLEAERERTHQALETANAGTWEYRIAERELLWSPELRALYGLPEAAPNPGYREWRALIHPDDVAGAVPTIAALGPQDAYFAEFRAWLDGGWKWIGSRAKLLRAADGTPVRVVGINMDLTGPRAAELATTAAVARFRAAVEAMSGVLWTNSPDGQMLGEQHGWSALTGQAPADYTGHGWADAVHPDDAQPTIDAWAVALEARSPFAFEHRVRVVDGSYRWFSVRALPVIADGEIREWVGVHTDIDDARNAAAALEAKVAAAVAAREEALAQLHEAQKLETIGQLTGGVAHDFNNLLTPIIGSLDLLSRRGPDPKAARLIDGALAAADRAKTLVQRLLAFARRQALAARSVDVVALVEGIADLITRSIGPDIAFVFAPDDRAIYAEVDPAQLELALLNLALNARDAMSGRGRLTITVVSLPAAPGLLAPGDYVRLTVADTGIGMDAETRRRAIEPFFTTKGIGRGTGLGLSMVHGVAAQSGGLLELDSAVGAGTQAHLWLPVARTMPTAATPAATAVRGTPATVLLVDDEPLVRAASAAMLVDLGHRVIECDGPTSALAHADDPAIDLVVSDFIMPGMNGGELIAALRACRPGLPALIITGFTDCRPDDSGVKLLAKPFGRDQLSAAIADARTAERSPPAEI